MNERVSGYRSGDHWAGPTVPLFINGDILNFPLLIARKRSSRRPRRARPSRRVDPWVRLALFAQHLPIITGAGPG